ncbi:hypothetical protein Leryth_020822 [Lithospermum erythrorhizon]|nr:hypothetical protein Leryth_020822 [Lithospermum erythrorhizon]
MSSLEAREEDKLENCTTADDFPCNDNSRNKRSSIAVVFRYADWFDILLMVLGTIGAIGDGMSTNCILVFASRLFNILGYGANNQQHNIANGNFMDEIEKCSLYFVYLGMAVMVMAFLEGYCWSKTSERQVLKIRYKYLEAILRQEVGFFDSQEGTTSEVTNSISKDTSLIQEVLSEKGIAKGLAVGSTGISFAIWALLAWYGSRLVMYKGESGGRIYAAGISFVLGGLSLGMALPEMKYFTDASVAASRICDRIDRIPEIDGENQKGLVLKNIRGQIDFKHVKFVYPSRPDSPVLQDFDLRIEAGKTVALVGASGSGKSTAIALVQRFYDASGGVVCIDGVDIKALQLKWLRKQMGLVSQDHALFGTSIKENIMFGKLDATMNEVVTAAMAANAHDFIRQLPDGYETKIGERGSLLSGGQKQRIAIARAIIRNPVILLLDEATSALDSESETLVQGALDQASVGRTTLVVAHKLSTVRNADFIAVMSGGCITEIGSHSELIGKNGQYEKLVKLQRQFSAIDQDQPFEYHKSSAARSSSGRRSSAKESPTTFASPSAIQERSTSQPIPYPIPPFIRLISLNLPEIKQGLIGSLSAIAFGAIQPIYALTIGGMISAFFTPSHAEMNKKIDRYVFIFCSLCIASLVVNICQHYSFAYMDNIFYDVQQGSVKVDGVDIRLLDIGWYRNHMALVSQEPVIFSGSIHDNITFGKLDASENEVMEAARAANAHEFISSLKIGYDTECGDRGLQLSGGQKQRIAIARAIIRNPIILLLDEATSALDVQSEQAVQEALDRIMVGRTTVVVAHRLNTIKKLDSIAFVSEGKVSECGSYEQLKNKRGAFFNLLQLQNS